MLVIGLTGGIGSGKSAVALMLPELGAALIAADKVGQEAGFLNVFAMEVHGIVDVVEGLFIKTIFVVSFSSST